MVRYNNEPQFFVADAAVFMGLVTDIMERLGPYLEPDSVDEESLTRLREAVQLIERKTTPRDLSPVPAEGRGRPATMRHLYLAATGQNRGKTTASLGLLDGFRRRGLPHGVHEARRPAHGHRGRPARGRGRRAHEVDLRACPSRTPAMSPVHIPRGFTKAYIAGDVVEDLGARIVEAHRPSRTTTCCSSRAPGTRASAR